MTAATPTPGMALYEGAWDVTRGPDGRGGEVVGPLYEVQLSRAYAWNVESQNFGKWDQDGVDGHAPRGIKESRHDLISVHPTREAAEAWLRAYRDAQDRATNPERRRAVAEVPKTEAMLPQDGKEASLWGHFDPAVYREGGHGAADAPAPQPSDGPVVDWEARLWEALRPFAKAWEIAMLSSSGGRGLSSGQLGALAAHEVAGVHFQRAAALIAAMQEKKP